MASGHFAGDGVFTEKCQAFLEQELGVPKALLTPSGTHALEMAALLLDIHPGDEVIIPAFTFPSTANAFVLRGAKPVFVDVREDTLNLDEAQLGGLITPRTKVIVVVHYAGVGCEMDRIMEIARRHGVGVIEDNALGLFGTYRGVYLGTLGCMAALSFHGAKNLTCGEGGALLINDQRYVERAEMVREMGTDRSRFRRGEIPQYRWQDIGSSYVLSDLLAAVLLAQLEARVQVQAARRRIWKYYYAHLFEWAQSNGVRLPYVPTHCEQAYHMFYLLLPSLKSRDKLLAYLKGYGIHAASHYVPLHCSEMGRRIGGSERTCPVSARISERLLRLPFYNGLSDDELDAVVNAVCAFVP
jgi:dTDP-4-amino-4,6-dideoxygalactose transaminase